MIPAEQMQTRDSASMIGAGGSIFRTPTRIPHLIQFYRFPTAASYFEE